jgi:hypothetical protein
MALAASPARGLPGVRPWPCSEVRREPARPLEDRQGSAGGYNGRAGRWRCWSSKSSVAADTWLPLSEGLVAIWQPLRESGRRGRVICDVQGRTAMPGGSQGGLRKQPHPDAFTTLETAPEPEARTAATRRTPGHGAGDRADQVTGDFDLVHLAPVPPGSVFCARRPNRG